MPPEPFSDVKFEIGHVLFIDIVAYSKLLFNEQRDQIQRLKDSVLYIGVTNRLSCRTYEHRKGPKVIIR